MELLDIISLCEQKEQGRVLVVPTASGQIDFIGPRGASLNTNIISMTSLCLLLSAADRITAHNEPRAAWKVNYPLGMFEHGMSYGCDAGSCYQPRDNTWHVTQTLRDANTSVIYGNNPWVRRSGLRPGTNERLHAAPQHTGIIPPLEFDASRCFAWIVSPPAGVMSVGTIWRPPVTRLWPFPWHTDTVVICLAPGAVCPAQI